MTPTLFAVYLGGRAPRCNTEVHDVVFVVAETIEAAYDQCLDLWFGSAVGLHLDSYMALETVDGHEVTLEEQPVEGGKRLFFINLGAYTDGLFTELHANMLVVASDAGEAKVRAKRELMQSGEHQVHTDDLYDVDDCLEVAKVGPWHVALTPCAEGGAPAPVNGYHVIPKRVIAAFLERHPERA